MRFNFSSQLDMGRVTGKYMRIGDGDGEGKTHPHPVSLSCVKLKYLYGPKLYLTIKKKIKNQ